MTRPKRYKGKVVVCACTHDLPWEPNLTLFGFSHDTCEKCLCFFWVFTKPGLFKKYKKEVRDADTKTV